MNEGARLLERTVRGALLRWRLLSFDAKVIGALGLFNWLLLFKSDTIVQVTRDGPIWQLFPGLVGPAYLFVVGVVALAYPWRDLYHRESFGPRARWIHLGAIVAVFVILPSAAAVVLRATGQPWTYVHDGALMAEEAAKKLLAGHNPYSVDYVDTPLFYWPMVNNPALYHFTYFPLVFLLTIPAMLLASPLGWFDERLLFLPAFVGCLWLASRMAGSSTAVRLSAVAAIALNSQFFPFVIEGRNDAFVLFFVFATLLLLQRDRRVLAGVALAIAAGLKLHALVLVPFVFVYLIGRSGARRPSEIWRAIAPTAVPFAILSALVFIPFLVWDAYGMWDDVVLYNAGASAWSYPVAGIGFSMLLHGLGVIPYRTAEFPFWIFELAAAIPVAIFAMHELLRRPSIPSIAFGYALTLLAFLFFGRYFQTSYLGYIVAAITPALFVIERTRPVIVVPAPVAGGVPSQAAAGEP